MKKEKKNIDTKKLMLNATIKALIKTADKYANITMVKLKNTTNKDFKDELNNLNISYYEVDITGIDKIEVDENGKTYSPIATFLNKDENQKVLIIKINNLLKKKDLENLANLKIFCEINGEGILPNTLIILDEKTNNLLKDSIEKMNEDYRIKYSFIFHDIMSI